MVSREQLQGLSAGADGLGCEKRISALASAGRDKARIVSRGPGSLKRGETRGRVKKERTTPTCSKRRVPSGMEKELGQEIRGSKHGELLIFRKTNAPRTKKTSERKAHLQLVARSRPEEAL